MGGNGGEGKYRSLEKQKSQTDGDAGGQINHKEI